MAKDVGTAINPQSVRRSRSMNKMHSSVLAVCCLGLLGVACSRKPDSIPVTSTRAKDAPAWIDNPQSIPSAIVGVGVENPNPMDDTMMQRKVALANARAEIAKQMSVRVQGLFGLLSQQYDVAASDGNIKPVSKTVMDRMVDDTQRELVNVELAGATPRQFWTDPGTRKLYVLVTIDKDSADRAMKAAATTAIRKEIASGEKGLQEALGHLDEALAKQK